LKQAYRSAAAANHPDRGGTTERMVLVNEAFAVLSDYVCAPAWDDARDRRVRREHPVEPHIRRVALVIGTLMWVAGLIDSMHDPAAVGAWSVMGLPL
jgi:hypothetical protein